MLGPVALTTRAEAFGPCGGELRLPTKSFGCIEIAKFGKATLAGVFPTTQTTRDEDVETWLLTTRTRKRIPGYVTVADRDAFVYVTIKRGVATAHLRTLRADRKVGIFASSTTLMPITNNKEYNGAINTTRSGVALFIVEREPDFRIRVSITNLSKAQTWVVDMNGSGSPPQRLRWSSDNTVIVGERAFDIETGQFSN